jgi:Uma2 family endonuclease
MIPTILPTLRDSLIYPESDGLPMADNSRQFNWIFVIYGNLAALFSEVKDVLVGGNMFWYPVEGHPEIVQAPDVFVVFGRPKGHRRSFQQWQEGGIPMTVVFEILSPKNSHMEMVQKLLFYEDYGVEEYYVYDPETNLLLIYLRRGTTLVRFRAVTAFTSPRLGIRFDFSGPEMVVIDPTGKRFLTFEELKAEHDRVKSHAEQARQQAEQARQQAEQALQQAEESRQRAEQAQQQVEQARQRASRLAELSRKARRQLASAEELAELDRLEQEMFPPSS